MRTGRSVSALPIFRQAQDEDCWGRSASLGAPNLGTKTSPRGARAAHGKWRRRRHAVGDAALNFAAMAADDFQIAAIRARHQEIKILGQRCQIGKDRGAAGAQLAFPDQRPAPAAPLACDRDCEHARLPIHPRHRVGGGPPIGDRILPQVAAEFGRTQSVRCGNFMFLVPALIVPGLLTRPAVGLSCVRMKNLRSPKTTRMRAARWTAIALLGLLSLGGMYLGELRLTGNFHIVVPGQLYRSGQPSAVQIAEYNKEFGIKTIINLRGPDRGSAWYDGEVAE